MPQLLSLEEILTKATEDALSSRTETPLILIDGRAGAGKSTFAKELQNRLFLEGESAPKIIQMDDLYPGWEGLAEGAAYLQRMILQPLMAGKVASWQEYDWGLESRKDWREFAGGTPLIVEGCGSISKFSASVATTSIWLEVPEVERRKRWLGRDGEIFNDYFETWAAQELDFIALNRPAELATYFYDFEAKL